MDNRPSDVRLRCNALPVGGAGVARRLVEFPEVATMLQFKRVQFKRVRAAVFRADPAGRPGVRAIAGRQDSIAGCQRPMERL